MFKGQCSILGWESLCLNHCLDTQWHQPVALRGSYGTPDFLDACRQLFFVFYIYIYINSTIHPFFMFSLYSSTDTSPCNILHTLLYMPCTSLRHTQSPSLLPTPPRPTPTLPPTLPPQHANEVVCLARGHPLAHWLIFLHL